MFEVGSAFLIYLCVVTCLGVIAFKLWTNRDIPQRRRIFLASISTTFAGIIAIVVVYVLQMVSSESSVQGLFLTFGGTVILADSVIMSILKYPSTMSVRSVGNSLLMSSAYYFAAVALAFVLIIFFWVMITVPMLVASWFA